MGNRGGYGKVHRCMLGASGGRKNDGVAERGSVWCMRDPYKMGVSWHVLPRALHPAASAPPSPSSSGITARCQMAGIPGDVQEIRKALPWSLFYSHSFFVRFFVVLSLPLHVVLRLSDDNRDPLGRRRRRIATSSSPFSRLARNLYLRLLHPSCIFASLSRLPCVLL